MYINLDGCLTSKVNIITQANKDNNNTFCFNNQLYYYKDTNLNEFIGEALAERINLRTVNFNCFEYFISTKQKEIIIASKSFINPTSTYSYIEETKNINVDNFLDKYKNMCLDDNNFNRFRENIFKMFAIDIYMGQYDRHEHNCQIERYDTGYIDLAPLYDYSESYFYSSFIYENPFYTFFNEDDYTEFFEKYPDCREILKKVKSFDLIKIIHFIEETKGFKLPDMIIEEYKKKEEKTQKKLEKIIK